ncbi:MAG: IS1595 family transposase [Chitinophagaceae bacterium]
MYYLLSHQAPKMTNFKTLTQLLDTFKDEATCRLYLEQQRWSGKPECPFCGCTKAYRINRGFKCADKFCAKKFSVITGSIYENNKVGLRVFFAAMYLISSSKKGISSLQLSRQLGITQKSAWFVLHRIREMLREKNPTTLTGTIQLDETYVGGKAKNRHKSKRMKGDMGRSMEHKTPVFGALQTDGKVRAYVVPDVSGATLIPMVREMVEKGSTMVTDEWSAFRKLKLEYDHVVIRHKIEEYVVGTYHTNSIEGFLERVKERYLWYLP